MKLKMLFVLLAVCFVQTLGNQLNTAPKSEKLRNIETIQLAENLVHFKKSISTYSPICPDPTYSCDDTQKCCHATTPTGFGCCSYSDGVCCPDLTRCCPGGTTCVEGGCL